MDNLKTAKELLKKNNEYTCVLCRDGVVYTDTKRGIAPMISFLEQGTDLRGFCAADRVVGKAAAFLFALAGVEAVYAEVLGKTAIPVFEEYKIVYRYGTLTEKIINRKGTDICPMEKAVAELTEPQEAYTAVTETLNKQKQFS